jgi:uncharacterized protein YxjI
MPYLLRQKLLSFGDDFTIKDGNGNDVYYVDGRVFSIGDKLSFQDMAGNELAFIHQRLLTLGKTYLIDRNGTTTTVHKHLFTFLRCAFTVDLPGTNDLEARGDLLDHEYGFYDSTGVEVATVSKRWFSFSDTYGVDINPGWDEVLILAATVVIDLCCHADQKH